MQGHALRYLAFTVSLWLLACGPDQSALVDAASDPSDGRVVTDGQPGSDGQTATDGAVSDPDGGVTDPDGGVTDPDAAVPSAAFCQLRCDVPGDCDLGSPPYDTDNYDCQGGACVYTGCTGDLECQALGDYVCRMTGDLVYPVCQVPCITPADCDLGSAPYDTDNYDCESGACTYTGCNDDAECQALGNYRCRTLPGSSVATCQVACLTPGDCDLGSPPYDVDNYDCQDGICVYQGCNDTAECQAIGDYVCASI